MFKTENRMFFFFSYATMKQKATLRPFSAFTGAYPGFITKTCLYNVDPLKSHFYIVKLGFTGVYIIFLISAQNIDCGYSLENIDCGYSLEPPRRGGSNEYPQSMFWAEIGKISEFLSDFFFKYFGDKNFQYIWIGLFSKWLLKPMQNSWKLYFKYTFHLIFDVKY